MDINIIKKIIEDSICAPSGDNSQPWSFKIEDNSIFVYNVPGKDTSLYNFKMWASLIAIGALLENIKISANHYGYDCDIEIKDHVDDSQLIAKFILQKTETSNDFLANLFPYIKQRKTNRKPYKKELLRNELLQELKECTASDDVNFKLEHGSDVIKKVASASSANELVVLEHKKLHDFLFNHITWTEEEDKIKKGFFIKTLELKGPQKFMFKLLKSWKTTRFLNRLGVSKLVSKENATLYARSASMLAVVSKNLDTTSFVKTGMLLQRLWLVCTKHNAYMQPLTGVLFLNHRLSDPDNKEFLAPKHSKLIKESYNNIITAMNISEGHITMLLRVGYADEPSASTLRHNADIRV